MKFTKTQKTDNPGESVVFMHLRGVDYYVCDMVDNSNPNHVAINELGLTLRSRLARSNGKFAMLEGTIFNPERLLTAACAINDYQKKEIIGVNGKKGYTLLTITADDCVNTFMIFDKSLLGTLTGKMDLRVGKLGDEAGA